MKLLILFLLLSTLAQSQEPVRTYSDGYAIANDEHRPLLVFVSGKNCGPCKVLKRDVLEPMRLKQQFGECVLVEVDGESSQGAAVTKIRLVPQLIAFSEGVRYSIALPITREKIVAMLETIRLAKGR